MNQASGLDHYELSRILSSKLDSGGDDQSYHELLELTCLEAVDFLEQLESQGEQERAEWLYKCVLKEQIEAFVVKRKNIFAALKMDIEDKGNIQSFSQNFFVTEVSEENNNSSIEEEIE